MSLKDIIKVFVDFRHEVVVRRTKFDLEKAQKRAHILEGLIKAIDVIDEIIRIIRASKTVDEAKSTLISTFAFSDAQATAIVEMKLRQLTGLERERLQAEYDELEKFIAWCNDVLANPAMQMDIIKSETQELKAKYGDKRRSEIVPNAEEFNPEDFYADDDEVITISHFGYIKSQSVDTYKAQRRGGRGISGMTRRDEDFVENLFVASTHDFILFFTSKGRVFRIKGYEIPESQRAARGANIINLLQIEQDEKVTAMIKIGGVIDDENTYLTMITKQGVIKRTRLTAYRNVRKGGLNAISLDEGDELKWVRMTGGEDELIVATHDGIHARLR